MIIKVNWVCLCIHSVQFISWGCTVLLKFLLCLATLIMDWFLKLFQEFCFLLWKSTSWNSLAAYCRNTFDSIDYVIIFIWVKIVLITLHNSVYKIVHWVIWRSWGIASRFLNLGARYMWVVSPGHPTFRKISPITLQIGGWLGPRTSLCSLKSEKLLNGNEKLSWEYTFFSLIHFVW